MKCVSSSFEIMNCSEMSQVESIVKCFEMLLLILSTTYMIYCTFWKNKVSLCFCCLNEWVVVVVTIWELNKWVGCCKMNNISPKTIMRHTHTHSQITVAHIYDSHLIWQRKYVCDFCKWFPSVVINILCYFLQQNIVI